MEYSSDYYSYQEMSATIEKCSLEKLFPIEMVEMILEFLTVSDITRFSLTCRAFYTFITQCYDRYWKILYLERWKCIKYCPVCVSTKCPCSDWNCKPERNWKSKFLQRLDVENKFNAGGHNSFYQQDQLLSTTIVLIFVE